jgi:hypothetical protein
VSTRFEYPDFNQLADVRRRDVAPGFSEMSAALDEAGPEMCTWLESVTGKRLKLQTAWSSPEAGKIRLEFSHRMRQGDRIRPHYYLTAHFHPQLGYTMESGYKDGWGRVVQQASLSEHENLPTPQEAFGWAYVRQEEWDAEDFATMADNALEESFAEKLVPDDYQDWSEEESDEDPQFHEALSRLMGFDAGTYFSPSHNTAQVLGEALEGNWAKAAATLLKQSKGKKQSDFHYRAYLRELIAGRPTSHLMKYRGAKQARQALIDAYGAMKEAKKHTCDCANCPEAQTCPRSKVKEEFADIPQPELQEIFKKVFGRKKPALKQVPCPSGRKREGGRCVLKTCPPGQEINKASGRCKRKEIDVGGGRVSGAKVRGVTHQKKGKAVKRDRYGEQMESIRLLAGITDPTYLTESSAMDEGRWTRMPRMPRDFYLPQGLKKTRPNIDPEGTDLAIWTWEEKGKPYGVAFSGKSNKPIFNGWFASESSRAKEIARIIENSKRSAQIKAQRRKEAAAARKAAAASVKVGDFYYSSWGYNQTNVEFFQVTGVKGQTVTLREVAQKTDHSTRGADYVVPVKGKFIGKPMKKRIGTSIKIDDVRRASPWKGKAVYRTASGWGH